MAYKKTLTGPGGIKLLLDHGDAATPAIVESRDGKFSSTINAATGEGELLGRNGVLTLTEAQLAWLDTHEDAVDAAYNAARKGMKEYE